MPETTTDRGSLFLRTTHVEAEPGALRAAREALHLTQFEVGLRIRRNPSNISRWEAGGALPLADAIAIAGVLGLDAELAPVEADASAA